jgi:hypothetical protein
MNLNMPKGKLKRNNKSFSTSNRSKKCLLKYVAEVVLKFDSRLEIQGKFCCHFFMESEGPGNIHAASI